MLQSIEKKREAQPFEVEVTVMPDDRSHFLGSNDSFFTREDAAPSLSKLLTVISDVVPDASPQRGFLTLLAQRHPSPNRTRSQSLSHTEKFSAEEPIARFDLVVLAASPNTRSTQAAATLITTMTEQHRCAAA